MTPAEIRQEREARQLTQDELAAQCGVSTQTIRNWESGRRTPSPRFLRALKAELKPCTCACHVRTRRRAGTSSWTSDEDALLLKLLDDGASPDDVVTALSELHEVTRSRTAVVHRARDLGWSFYRDQLTAGDVGRLLGVNHARVGGWIARGLLVAKHHANLRSGQPSRWWCIKPSALDAFIERYAGTAFDPALVPDRARRAQAEVAAAVNRRRAS